jgi:flagellar biosynthetic protein FliQ
MNIFVEIAQQGLWLILWLSIFPLLASLIVGLVISLLQALTQVQEQTLTFVPKALVTILVLIITALWMLETLMDFCKRIFELMLQVGSGR